MKDNVCPNSTVKEQSYIYLTDYISPIMFLRATRPEPISTLGKLQLQESDGSIARMKIAERSRGGEKIDQ